MSHLWFATAEHKDKTPASLTPITTDLTVWLTYWGDRRNAAGGAAANITKALHHMAPQSRAHFDGMNIVSAFSKTRDDWDIFVTACRRAFKTSKTAPISSPFNHSSWNIHVQAHKDAPRSQVLRRQVVMNLATVRQMYSYIMGKDGVTNAQKVNMAAVKDTVTFLDSAIPDFPAFNPAEDALPDAARVYMIAGIAMYAHFQAVGAFRYHNLPASLQHEFNDQLEKLRTQHEDLQLHTTVLDNIEEWLLKKEAVRGQPPANNPRANACKAALGPFVQMVDASEAAPAPTDAIRGGHRGRNRNRRGGRGGRGGRGSGNQGNRGGANASTSAVDTTANQTTAPQPVAAATSIAENTKNTQAAQHSDVLQFNADWGFNRAN